MATEETLRKIESAMKQPSAWEYTGSLGAILATLPRVGGKSPVRVISGREEEMMNGLGYNTAWTDGTSVTFTSKFLAQLTDLGLAFVLLHECGHIALKHMARRRTRAGYTWNIAGDIKINDILERHVIPNFLKKTGQAFQASMMFVNKKPLGIGFTKDTKSWLNDFRLFSEEEIYYMLEEELRRVRMKENTPGQGGGNGKGKGKGKGNSPSQGNGGGGGSGGGQSPQPGQAQDFDFDQAEEDAFDDHIESGLDLRKELEDEYGEEGKELADSMGLPENQEQQAQMDQTADKALNAARQLTRSSNSSRQAGNHVDSFIEEAIEIDRKSKAKYNWSFEITGMMEEAMLGNFFEAPDNPDELSEWSMIPELQSQMGFGQIYRPDVIRKRGTGNLLVVLDTSGSMGDNDLQMSLVELRGVAMNNKVRITFVSADTVARDRLVLEPDDLLEFPTSMPISGGGGTDMFTPVVQEVVAADKKYDVCMILTDGYFGPYEYSSLVEAIQKESPEKVNTIPPIAFVITTDYYDNPELNRAAATFPQGHCKVYGLVDPKVRAMAPDIKVSNDGIGQ